MSLLALSLLGIGAITQWMWPWNYKMEVRQAIMKFLEIMVLLVLMFGACWDLSQLLHIKILIGN